MPRSSTDGEVEVPTERATKAARDAAGPELRRSSKLKHGLGTVLQLSGSMGQTVPLLSNEELLEVTWDGPLLGTPALPRALIVDCRAL